MGMATKQPQQQPWQRPQQEPEQQTATASTTATSTTIPTAATATAATVTNHGSNHSTTDSFVRAVEPEIAIVSNGSNNYGHPGDEVLERLEHHGVVIYRTDDSGHIALASSGQGIEVVDGIPWSSDRPRPGSPGDLPGNGNNPVTVAHAGTGEAPDLSGVRDKPPAIEEPTPRKGCLFRRP